MSGAVGFQELAQQKSELEVQFREWREFKEIEKVQLRRKHSELIESLELTRSEI